MPCFWVIVSSSFIYVALADLIPQLQKSLSFSQTAAQIFWLAMGVGMVTVASGFPHAARSSVMCASKQTSKLMLHKLQTS